MALAQTEGVCSRAGIEYAIAFPLENRVGHFANVVVVVHQQDGLGSSPACGLALRPARESGRALRIYCRQVDPEGRAAGGRAFHRDGPSALADDPENGGEPETRSLADLLGGEERLEDARLRALVHSGSGILDRE